MDAMASYLVTGGCGFIGSHLVDALCAGGHRVRVLDDLSSGTLRHKPAEVEFVRGDVADLHVVEAAMRGVDACFHLAAVASVERSKLDWLGTHRTNLTGMLTVFESARKAPGNPIPVVYASSAAVYGDNANLPLTEAAFPRPLSAYGADKLGCELHGQVAYHVHGIPNCGLRFFNVYGPRQDPGSPYSGVISIFCKRLKAGREVTIYGDGRQTRDFIYVGDVITALIAAMNSRSLAGETINVCTGRPTSVLELARTIGEILGHQPAIRFAPPRDGEIRNSLGDPMKAERLLGFAARTDLKSGISTVLTET
jgi:UDP-glucose 4-epimerase